jgi:pyrroloquinoline quinone biosynthesis protein D
VSRLLPSSQPRLRPGCRLSETAQQGDVLLIPEGVLRLVGPGRKIVERCDGRRTAGDIISELRAEFPSVDPDRIESEVNTFLDRLHQKGVLDIG